MLSSYKLIMSTVLMVHSSLAIMVVMASEVGLKKECRGGHEKLLCIKQWPYRWTGQSHQLWACVTWNIL